MTKQSIFNKVWRYFIIQRHPQSVDIITGSCMYRGPNGNRCAVGCVMPNRLYDESFEGRVIMDILRQNESLKEYFTGFENFLEELQSLHDDSEISIFYSSFSNSLRGVAKKEGLKIPKK